MNKVILMGRLTKDFTTNEAGTVARSSLAVDRGKDKDGNDRGADFINLVAWNSIQALTTYCTKGTKLLVEGRITTSSYEKDGRKIYNTDVTVDRWEFAESKSAKTSEAKPNYSEDEFMKIPENIDEELPFN